MYGSQNEGRQWLLHAMRVHFGTAGADAQALPPMTEALLGDVLAMAEAQKILPVVYGGLLAALGADCIRGLLGADAAEALRMDVRRRGIGQAVRSCDFRALYQWIEARGISLIVVKGALCRALYPSPDARASADEDLLVRADQLRPLLALLSEIGARPAHGDALPAEDEEVREVGIVLPAGVGSAELRLGAGLYLELHTTLFGVGDGVGEAADACFADAWERAVRYDTGDGGSLLSLCPQEHLLYLILHALKHFVHAGFGIRQICDIALFARRYAGEIDFGALYDTLVPLHAVHFAHAVFAAAEEFLGLCVPLGSAWRAEARLDCEPLLQDVLSGGIYGGTDDARLHSVHLTLRAAENGGSTVRGLWNAAFPPAETMCRRYPWLKGRPYLLWAAFGARIFGYFGARLRRRGVEHGPADALRVGAERVRLLAYYGIGTDENGCRISDNCSN